MNHNRHGLAVLFHATLALIGALFVGCATSEMKVTRGMDTGLGAEDAIVIFPNRMGAASAKDVEFAECVEEAILSNRPGQRFVGAAAFRDALFPWFEPNVAPKTPDDLRKLLARPLVEDRISELAVRYVIAIAGGTTETTGLRPFFCGYTGCIGLAWWDRDTSLTAVVWDLKRTGEAGAVETRSSGTAIVPAFILPLPFIPRTESTACDELGRGLLELLVP